MATSLFGHVRLVLASTSPRRVEILSKFFTPLATCAPDFDESSIPWNEEELTPAGYVELMARRKAESAVAVHRSGSSDDERPCLIVSADTMIFAGGRLLGKPSTLDSARETLRSLRGKRHQVLSGVCVVCARSGRVLSLFHESTDVDFADADDATIEWYVQTGEPLGKAGSYAIQGVGCMLVAGIHGCYWNVMGFPIHRFLLELRALAL